MLEILLVGLVGKNLSGDHQRSACPLRRSNREVKAFFRTNPAQRKRIPSLSRRHRERVDINSLLDRSNGDRTWLAAALLAGGNAYIHHAFAPHRENFL